jgi:hypothetical protein
MPSLPSPVRAALGLAATLLDEARTLPDKAIELPMLAVSKTLQLSLKAQQRYSALEARGDEVLSGRQATDEAPEWATFDPPAADVTVSTPQKKVNAPRNGAPSAFDAVIDD